MKLKHNIQCIMCGKKGTNLFFKFDDYWCNGCIKIEETLLTDRLDEKNRKDRSRRIKLITKYLEKGGEDE